MFKRGIMKKITVEILVEDRVAHNIYATEDNKAMGNRVFKSIKGKDGFKEINVTVDDVFEDTELIMFKNPSNTTDGVIKMVKPEM